MSKKSPHSAGSRDAFLRSIERFGENIDDVVTRIESVTPTRVAFIYDVAVSPERWAVFNKLVDEPEATRVLNFVGDEESEGGIQLDLARTGTHVMLANMSIGLLIVVAPPPENEAAVHIVLTESETGNSLADAKVVTELRAVAERLAYGDRGDKEARNTLLGEITFEVAYGMEVGLQRHVRAGGNIPTGVFPLVTDERRRHELLMHMCFSVLPRNMRG